MENTNIPDTVKPSQLVNQPDGTPVPDALLPAGDMQTQSTPISTEPGLPPLDPNDPNANLPKHPQTQQQPSQSQSSIGPVLANPLPVDKSTFATISNRHQELSDYILPDISRGAFMTFRNSAPYNLPFDFGFDNLDAIQDVAPGLYILGAASSMGKTTFALQLADQIAFQGQPVLYFSREMSPIDMMTKSISRLIHQQAGHDALYQQYTALQIRKGEADGTRELAEQLDYYQQHGLSNIAHIKLNSSTDIHYILDYVQDFMNTTGKKPVVVIDYLQIIGSTKMTLPDDRVRIVTDVRENLQRILEITKDFQLNNNLFILMVSSINRSNYYKDISFEAFKETGSIEYTADVVWGLQLSVNLSKKYIEVLQSKDASLKLIEKIKRQVIDEEKAKDIRQMKLMALKNRFGIAQYSIDFEYDCRYETYIPKAKTTTTSNSTNNEALDDIIDDDDDDYDNEEAIQENDNEEAS